jgi:beta-1,4-mannosyl-glycoprotein beta-1,4-N-acetylglucosaminyltransferase
VAVWDVFSLYDELDLLEYRLGLLWDVVDHFVICEAPTTFTGADKPLNFECHRDRFARFASKIIHHPVRLAADHEHSWLREHEQRRHMHGFVRDHAQADDLVIFRDVDEIPRPGVIAALTDDVTFTGPQRLSLRHANYYANWYQRPAWDGSLVFSPRHDLGHPAVQTILGYRFTPPSGPAGRLPSVPRAGWHLSFLGGPSAVGSKLRAYSHQEYRPRSADDETHVDRCIEYGVHITGLHVLEKDSRAELDPALEALLGLRPDFFRFEPQVELRSHALAGYAWARHRRLVIQPFRAFADRHPSSVVGWGAPLWWLVDSSRRLVAKGARWWTDERSDRAPA